MNRILALIPVLVTLALAAPAGATTYCVNSPACVASGGTDKGADAAALDSALTTAQGAPGKDRVEVGPGAYARAGGFSYSGGLNNPLELVGAGGSATTLTNTTTGRSLIVDADGSSIVGVGAVTAPSSGASAITINGAGSTAKDIAATTQAGSTSGIGVTVGKGATVTGAHVAGGSPWFLYGVAGAGTLQDSRVDGAGYGVYGPTEIHRVHVSNAGTGIYANGSPSYKIDQVLVEVPATDYGIVAATTSFTGSATTVDHATIVGPGDKSSLGFSATATSGGAAHDTDLVVRSSVVRGVGHALNLNAMNGAANIKYDHSDVDASTAATDIKPGGSGAITDMGANLNVDPQFDAAFHIGAGSPVVDQGAAAVQPNESATDLAGANRLSGAATDMGAFEYQVPPPPPPAAGQGDPGTPPAPVESGSGSSAPASSSGDAPTATDAGAQPAPDGTSQILPPATVRPISMANRSCARAKRSAKRTKHGRRVRKAASCTHKKPRKHRHRKH
jgi:hypothetical protein